MKPRKEAGKAESKVSVRLIRKKRNHRVGSARVVELELWSQPDEVRILPPPLVHYDLRQVTKPL